MDNRNDHISNIVNQAKQGDENAWESLYSSTHRNAYFVAVKVVGDKQDAYDLVQEAYLTAYEKLKYLDAPEKFQAWLNMIVANKCRDYLRKMKPTLFSELQTDDGIELDWVDDREEYQPDLSFDHNETIRLIAEMVDELPADQKLCITLYYKDMLSIEEIAETIEVSEGTVKSRLYYARKKVAAKVEALEKEGIKLYGITPIPLLIWLLNYEAATIEIPTALLATPTTSVSAVSAGTAAASQSAAAASSAVSIGAQAAATSTIAKFVAGITVVALLAGSATVYLSNQNPEPTANIKHNAYSEAAQTNPHPHETDSTYEYAYPTVSATEFITDTIADDKQNNILEEALDFSKGWMILVDNGKSLIAFAFEPDRTFRHITGYWEGEATGFGDGTYTISGNEITFNLNLRKEQQSISYIFDPDTLKLTQISDVGLAYDHNVGTILQLEEYPSGKEKIIDLAETLGYDADKENSNNVTIAIIDQSGKYPRETIKVLFEDETGLIRKTFNLAINNEPDNEIIHTLSLPSPAIYHIIFVDIEEGYIINDALSNSATIEFHISEEPIQFDWAIIPEVG